LISFLIGAVPGLLGLLEKKHLLFSDSQVLVMGNLLAAGMVTGFIVGGKAVDRSGSRPVFLTGHILFSLSLTGVLLRGFIPLPLTVSIGLFSFLFGAMQGAVGIAGTSELLAIIPPENKSLSTGFHMSLAAAGLTLSNLITGQILRWNLLQPEWVLFGKTLSAYDSIIAALILSISLMAATAGLIPVIGQLKSQWIPQNR
jgi:MFS family permease